jgi:hypothetical protein
MEPVHRRPGQQDSGVPVKSARDSAIDVSGIRKLHLGFQKAQRSAVNEIDMQGRMKRL